MTFTFYQVLLFTTIIFLGLFSIFLLLNKMGNRQGNIILVIMFFSYFMSIGNYILFTDRYFLDHFPHLFFIGNPFSYLWGPTYFLYLRSLTDSDFKLRWNHLIHGFLFCASFCYLLPRFIVHGTQEKLLLLHSGTVLTWPEISIINGICAIQLSYYVVASSVNMRNYRREIKNNFSSTDKTNVQWINFFYYSFSFKLSIDILFIILTITMKKYPNHIDQIWMIFLIIFILTITIIYKALQNPEIFLKLTQQVKYEGSALSEDEKDRIIGQLTDYMEKEHPQRQPNITIKELSEKLNVPARSLSQVLNERLRKNFFDFINSYRVKDFKNAIGSNKKRNFLETSLEVGFNSKSSFNKAFKKHTSMTPMQYKKSLGSSTF